MIVAWKPSYLLILLQEQKQRRILFGVQVKKHALRLT